MCLGVGGVLFGGGDIVQHEMACRVFICVVCNTCGIMCNTLFFLFYYCRLTGKFCKILVIALPVSVLCIL